MSVVVPNSALRRLRVLGLVSGADTAQTLRQTIGGEHELTFGRRDTAPAVGGLPDLAVVELNVDIAADIAWLERLVAQLAGQCAIVATCPRPSFDGLRRLMRLGIDDVLPQPLVADDLRAILLAVALTPPTARPTPVAGPSKVVSFLKAGGGAGATTLAVQMACAASKDQPGTVLLIDLDLQFGSAALHLDLPQKTSVADLLASAERLDGPMLRAAAAHHPSGVDLLAAPAQVMPLDLVEPQTALSLLDAARAGYGLVLVELPQTWTRWTRAVLEASDAAVLAVNLTVPSLRHARRQLETITEEGLGHLPLSVVANRVREGLLAKPSAISRAEAERVIGRPIAATLPYDDLLFRTATLGQPVGGLPGGKALAKRFARMIEQVTIPVSSEVKP